MHRLGPCKSHPREWESATAFYSRLTVSNHGQIRRDVDDYPPLTENGSQSQSSTPHHLLRAECLDLGHVRTYFELCKF